MEKINREILKARRLGGWLLLTLLVLAQPSGATDRIEQTKAADIQQLLGLLDVWGTTASLGPVIADEFAGSLREENPELSTSVSDSFRQALLDVLGSDLENSQSLLRQSYADLYDRNFSAAEIAELVAFYRTPTGQKYLLAQQTLLNDSAMVLQAWLNGARDRVIVRFEELMAIRSVEAQAALD